MSEESVVTKKPKYHKILSCEETKRDRQAIVRILVKAKKTTKKLVHTSKELKDCLDKMPDSLRFWLGMSALQQGCDPHEMMASLSSTYDVFNGALKGGLLRIKIARKRVKNKDYLKAL